MTYTPSEQQSLNRAHRYADDIALVTNDIRKVFIEKGIDPMGATEFEQGIYRAIDIIARAVQDGDIAAYEETA